jgi:hypothetical protein
MPEQTLPTPPGYRVLVALDTQKHRQRGISSDVATFARALQSVPIALVEFTAAARTFPLVFARDASDTLHCVALLGLRAEQNLFVDTDGKWLTEDYCPAYVRRYPFYPLLLGNDPRVAIAVDESALDNSLPHLFDQDGRATPRWQEIQRFLDEAERARRETAQFCARVLALDLLEPFEADINPALGPRQRLTGMQRVNEARLQTLPPATLQELAQNGYLGRLYAHLISLDNFQRLLHREVLQRRGAVTAP